MQAEEFRIGNILLFQETKGELFGINKDCIVQYSQENDVYYCGIDEVKPIDLTEEILLKCGFTLKGVIFRINNGLSHQFDINYSPSRNIFYYDSSKYWVYTEVEIKYLHQLQNLYFVLTGEELTINL